MGDARQSPQGRDTGVLSKPIGDKCCASTPRIWLAAAAFQRYSPLLPPSFFVFFLVPGPLVKERGYCSRMVVRSRWAKLRHDLRPIFSYSTLASLTGQKLNELRGHWRIAIPQQSRGNQGEQVLAKGSRADPFEPSGSDTRPRRPQFQAPIRLPEAFTEHLRTESVCSVRPIGSGT
ncbi:hypothetical protein GQ53DRAFT_740927, partial [Thozetella sp. PMI_491]